MTGPFDAYTEPAREDVPVDLPRDDLWRGPNPTVEQPAPLRIAWADAVPEAVARVGEDPPARAHEVSALLADDGWIDEAHALDTAFEQHEPSLLHRPLVADLHVVYAVDLPRGVRTLTAADRRALGLDARGLERLARQNLERRAPGVRIHAGGHRHLVYQVRLDGVFDASMLLVPAIWERMARRVEGDLVIAAPARDTLLCAGTAWPDDLRALRRMAERAHARSRHPIAATLLKRVDGRLVPLDG